MSALENGISTGSIIQRIDENGKLVGTRYRVLSTIYSMNYPGSIEYSVRPIQPNGSIDGKKHLTISAEIPMQLISPPNKPQAK